MINLFLYVLVISFIGLPLVVFLFNKKNYVSIISLMFPIGSVVITLYCWLLSVLKIEYSFKRIFIPLLIVSSFLIICLIIYKLKLKSPDSRGHKIEEKQPRNGRFWFAVIGVCGFVLVKYLTILLHSISTKVYQPDEYSQWAFQAKLIFLGKGLESFYGGQGFETGFETYPSFIPLLAASFYSFSGEILDSFVRVIGPVFLFCLTVFIYSEMKQYLKNIIINWVVIGIFLSSGFVVFEMSSGLYADIEYTFFYTVSVVFLIKYLIDNDKKKDMMLSALFITLAAWVKVDGQYLALVHIGIVCISFLYNGVLLKRLKELMIFSILSLSIPLMWRLYTAVRDFPDSRWSINPVIEYSFPMLSASIQQIMNTTNWGLFWIIVFSMVILNFYIGINKQQFYILALMIANILFLYFSYIVMFGEEAKTAASFARYILRIAPISMLYVSTVINTATKEISNENIGGNSCV